MTKVDNTATFPRQARLLTPVAFTAVFEKRNARRGRFFHLHVGAARLPEPVIDPVTATAIETQVSRLGIAVPKKLLKTAVHRNVVKRIAREVFRHLRQKLDGRDYVLRLAVKIDPKRQPLDRPALAKDVESLFAARRPAKLETIGAPGISSATTGGANS